MIRQAGQRIDQQRIELVGGLRQNGARGRRSIRSDPVEEEGPIDRPEVGKLAEPVQIRQRLLRHVGQGEYRDAVELCHFSIEWLLVGPCLRHDPVEGIARPHHRMAISVSCDREFDRDKGIPALRIVETNDRLFASSDDDALISLLTDYPGQEIMQDDPLVVPAHRLLTELEIAGTQCIHHLVVKSEEGGVKLRDDQVFIIALIAKQRAPDRGVVPRQIGALVSRLVEILVRPEKHVKLVVVIKERLVGRA